MHKKDDTEVHLRVIRQALARGNAAVMVGSGFSLNAENGRALKGWSALAQALFEELHPAQMVPPLGTSDMLRLAEEYHRAFSRSKLDNFLREQLPDEKVTPGPLHQALLKLNWSEIFTTNYDTLLERAADSIIETPHYVVMCREDIPESRIAKRRRIVKLHGSFPSQRPFIFTEEDYRLYPTNSAPFVNLVRQSLLENVFCLIGFSGDDPNFLQWIGWVRDMIEAHTLPIYLFLDKAPTFGQERLLQSRHITPVLLPNLESNNKSTFGQRYEELFKRLQPMELDAARSWPIETTIEYNYSDRSIDEQFAYLQKLIPVWRKTRSEYPGWLVAPFTTRERLYRLQESQDPSTLGSERMQGKLVASPVIGLLALSEFCWRQRVLLQPIWDDVSKVAELILLETAINLKSNAVWPLTGVPDHWKIENDDLTRAWQDLAIHFLRWCRQQMLSSKFELWADRIKQVASESPHILDSVTREEVQYLLLRGERSLALVTLEKWIPDPTEPYNGVLRAAWLAECGEHTQGIELAHSALRGIRKLSRLEPGSNFVLSREAWACQVTYLLKRSSSWFVETDSDEGRSNAELLERLRALGIREHDPEREIAKLVDLVNAEVHPRANDQVRTVDFDLGRTSSSFHFGGGGEHWRKIRNCFAWCELTDSVGYLPKVRNTTWLIDTFKQAAWWIKDNESQERVHGLMVRLGDTKLFDQIEDESPPHLRWLTRDDVARLRQDFAQQACADALRLALEELGSQNRNSAPSQERIAFQMERYSRLVLRETREERLREYADQMLQLYEDSRLQEATGIWKNYKNAFNRTIEALPDQTLAEYLPRIIGLPIKLTIRMVQQGHQGNWPDWPAPIWNRSFGVKTASLKGAAKDCALQAVANLSTGTSRESELQNIVVHNRLFWLLNNKLLDVETSRKIGDAFWKDHSQWPHYAGFTPFEILSIPTSTSAGRHRLFKEWLLSQELGLTGRVETHPDGSKRTVFGSSDDQTLLKYWLRSGQKSVTWSAAECVAIMQKVKSWWEIEGPTFVARTSVDSHPLLGVDIIRDRIEWLDATLAWHVVPRLSELVRRDLTLKDWLQEFLIIASSTGYGCWHIRLAMTLQRDAIDNVLVAELVGALFGNDVRRLEKAMEIVVKWCKQKSGPDCPGALIDALAACIASRRIPGLIPALKACKLILENRPDELIGTRLQLLNAGLLALWDDLSYANSGFRTNIPRQEVPAARLACAEFAYALEDQNGLAPSCIHWVKESANDPLPEIRQLK
jgi:hypothetical protein